MASVVSAGQCVRPEPPTPLRASFSAAAIILIQTVTVIGCGDAPAVDDSDDGILQSITVDSRVRIGGAEARGPAAFGQIRDVALLTNPPRVAVADWVPQAIQVFDLRGRYLNTLGRDGKGPGEYTGLSAVWGTADGGVVAWDQNLNRITVHHPTDDVEVISVDLAPFQGRSPRFLGALDDGTFAFAFPSHPNHLRGRPEGPYQDTVPFVRFDHAGQAVDTIAALAAPAEELFDTGVLYGSERPIFGARLLASLSNGQLLVASSAVMSFSKFTDDGRRTEVVSIPTAEPSVTAELAAAQRRVRLEDVATGVSVAGVDVAEIHREIIRDLRVEEVVPVLDDLADAPSGFIWAREFVLPSDSLGSWILLSEEGRRIGRICLPRDQRLVVGTDEVAVVVGSDTMGADFVDVLMFSELEY